MNLKRLGKFLLLTKLHILALAIIAYSFWPIANWYFNYLPVWGVDFFLTASLVNFLKQNLVMPYAFWNYAGFGGFPLFLYPFLHSYVISFLQNHFELIYSLQLWAMLSSIAFVIGGYFLFFTLSRSFVLAIILAVATAYSGGVYQTLTWAGSFPSYATQVAFPWVLMFLVWHFRNGSFRLFLTSALIAGISILGHPLVFLIYIVPAVVILIVTRFNHGLALKNKFKHLVVFFFVTFLIGLPQFYFSFASAFNSFFILNDIGGLSTTSIPAKIPEGIAEFNHLQVKRIITDNHSALFLLAIITLTLFLISFIIGAKKASIIQVIPYLILTLYFSFYIWLFGQGISIFHGGWYRLFWSVPIWVGALVAVFWGLMSSNISHFIKQKIISTFLIIILNVILAIIGAGLIYIHPYQDTIKQIIYRGQPSSANPDVISLKVSNQDREGLKTQLTPKWLNGDETNYRLYDGDQTVNIWWNSLYKMPLARGYLDPPSDSGYTFWLDAALSETDGEPQLVKSFKYPLETALSNAYFLIDWYGIRYYEGGHEGDVYTPLPKYLQQIIKDEQVLDFNQEKFTKRNNTLHYYSIEDDLTSPILAATNVPVIGVFGSANGFNTVIRSIAERGNLNSQKLIPLQLGKYVDVYNLNILKNFDALYLYDYDYKNESKTFQLLTDYVQSGKKIFIETGGEVKQSSGQLPSLFPVEGVQRKGLGRKWNLESYGLFSSGVKFENFDPPEFDNNDWNLSFTEEKNLRAEATVILKDQGKIIFAKQNLGSGEVIWSGMNLAYHLIRNHNTDEAKFFDNILAELTDVAPRTLPEFKAEFKNANLRLIHTSRAKGILFKEQNYDGWNAKALNSNKKTIPLRIFKAGPANPGFMYLPLPSGNSNTVTLSYSGSVSAKIIFMISFFVVVTILEYIVFADMFLGRLRKGIYRRSLKTLQRWWIRDDE